ncbi:MAG: MMPL family transporter [Desulfovibrio sp.]|nr:MMPL family transporter [Desulfovibrio sp.]
MFFFASLYRHSRKWVRQLSALALLFLAACALLSSQLTIREDIRSLIPTSPLGLAEQFAVLREAPLLQGLSIAVGGGEPALSAQLLSEALRSPEIPRVLSGLGATFNPRILPQLCRATPGLLDMTALLSSLDEDSIRASLKRDRDLLLAPQGIVLRDFLAIDPLGICAGVLQRLAPAAGSLGIRTDQGVMLNVDGAHALVLAEPALSMSDSKGAIRVMDRVRSAVQTLPPGTETIVVGGHRHTEENARVIRADVNRILPASMLLLALAFLIFVRTLKGLCIVLLPVAALVTAAAVTGLIFDELSGIVLGFGSVVLGITADYAIHVYFALRNGSDPADSLQRISGPILLGGMTTLAAFLVFFSSSIPCIIQMTVFAVCGVLTALILALGLLPPWLGPGDKQAADSCPLQKMHLKQRPLALLWLVLGFCLVLLLYKVPVNGDIRALSYVSQETARDEKRMGEIFGGLREQGLYAVRGKSLEEALLANDRIWEELGRAAPEKGWEPARLIASLAPLLPASATQTIRFQTWKNFWDAQSDAILPSLDTLATQSGFSTKAFDPFKDWIAGKPTPMTPDLLSSAGLEVALMLARPFGSSWLVYSLVRATEPPPGLMQTLENNGAIYISGRSFRAAMDEAIRSDLLRFGGPSLLAILVMIAFAFRSPSRMGIALLPVACGLASVLAAFRFLDMEMNIFHAMALPLVMALSVDYGIFILSHLEGRLGKESRTGVLLSGITTLSGFGVLLLTRHPALHSIGLTVSLGLSAALVTALVLLPHLADPANESGHA